MQLVLLAGLVVAALLGGAGARAHFIPRPQLRDPGNAMTLCGRHLAEARMLFCKEKGYALQKKSTIPAMNELARFEDRPDEGAESRDEYMAMRFWPWLERPRAKAFAMEGRGKRNGLVDECCLKPCTLEELLQYC